MLWCRDIYIFCLGFSLSTRAPRLEGGLALARKALSWQPSRCSRWWGRRWGTEYSRCSCPESWGDESRGQTQWPARHRDIRIIISSPGATTSYDCTSHNTNATKTVCCPSTGAHRCVKPVRNMSCASYFTHFTKSKYEKKDIVFVIWGVLYCDFFF